MHKTLEVMAENQLKFKKKFGQNFLIDENILKNIIAGALISEKTGVIEIGPGIGFLTNHLLRKAQHVLAYEIDPDFVEILNKEFRHNKNLTIRNIDCLQADINADIKKYLKDCDEVIVVANIPYNITTPLIFNLLENVPQICRYVLLMQKEVAERICSGHSTKEYNSLSIAIQYRTVTKKLFNVPRQVFIPRPNVDSAVISLIVKENQDKPDNETHFFSLVRNSFRHRRKTLVNNLYISYNLTKEVGEEILRNLGFNPLIRSENMTVFDFIRLSNALFAKDIS
ncbi:MAG: 16S rRNA (adenine(1518)-N(6)/adenine(1519)-N(6))-dimethyltransferase RsmA [Erysipelotrichales bacterium]|nr:16S rRNA (adenine(1518)-N(6)/adenine(1519)-N(6))-dimethyltransferase RsmA [Erysipelotrichales bacterium]